MRPLPLRWNAGGRECGWVYLGSVEGETEWLFLSDELGWFPDLPPEADHLPLEEVKRLLAARGYAVQLLRP